MSEVFHNADDTIAVGAEWLLFLKRRAQQSPLRRSRLCLHRAPGDLVHEMIIVMCQDVLFRPHRHRAKSESYHVIEGTLDVVFFSNTGIPENVIHMGPLGSGFNFCYRLSVPKFHAVLPRSDFVVIHETTSGPFVQNEAELASWSPTETEDLRAFLAASVVKARVKSENLDGTTSA